MCVRLTGKPLYPDIFDLPVKKGISEFLLLTKFVLLPESVTFSTDL
jgi:hypothetical protein